MERILSELRQMRLPGMAQTWQSLMETRQTSSLNVVDGLRLLLQGEHDMRRANRNARLLKKRPVPLSGVSRRTRIRLCAWS